MTDSKYLAMSDVMGPVRPFLFLPPLLTALPPLSKAVPRERSLAGRGRVGGGGGGGRGVVSLSRSLEVFFEYLVDCSLKIWGETKI